MKLKKGQTVHHSGKKYRDEVPDDIAEAVGLKVELVEESEPVEDVAPVEKPVKKPRK